MNKNNLFINFEYEERYQRGDPAIETCYYFTNNKLVDGTLVFDELVSENLREFLESYGYETKDVTLFTLAITVDENNKIIEASIAPTSKNEDELKDIKYLEFDHNFYEEDLVELLQTI